MYNMAYYNQQNLIDKINNQIADLEKTKNQLTQVPQPTNLTQNFQLSPSYTMRFEDSIDGVQKERVMVDTPFFSKDMSILWVKNASGDIKTYELKEIIKKDEKDLKIEFLQAQIEELKKGVSNAKPNNDDVNEPTKDEKSSNV